ncbi:MAG: ASKHA domain-containing protein, partial [Clostridiales bacterium]|nr:ASKHA domain-containing protein [Clostridiales bacterium]
GEIKEIVIAANTVMTHLLLGLPCEGLGKYPFTPTRPLEERRMLFGCPARIMPWLAGFIGGDILAGLLSVLPRGESCFLLIDLGTNGKIALYDKGALTVTATAAGPAFEGSGHRGGASAVLNDLAELLRSGLVDETGLLLKPENGIFLLSQKEIRDIQLAKSAVRSGLEILLHTAKLEYADLERVYLAGGIGQAMKVDDAVTIGLLPEALKEKVIAVGNASLGGAARLLLSPDSADRDIKALLSSHSEINLAGHPLFNDLFMEHLAFSRSG